MRPSAAFLSASFSLLQFLSLGFQPPSVYLAFLFVLDRQTKRLKDRWTFSEHHRLDLSQESDYFIERLIVSFDHGVK